MEKIPQQEESAGRHALKIGVKMLLVLIVIYIFAYGVGVTKINLEEPQDPQRQAVTTRVIRALARPDFFTYHEESRSMDVTVVMPCPAVVKGVQSSLEGRVVTMVPNCVNTNQDVLTISGTGFRPRTDGIVRWYPPGAVATTRALTSFRTDGEGNFEETFSFPDVRITEEPQRIEVEEQWNTGISGLSETSKITIEKIIETIFLALMATTVGTILAVPISFLAARNIMEKVGLPLASIMSAVVAIPFGYFLGFYVTQLLLNMAEFANAQIGLGFVVATAVAVISLLILRFGPPIFTDEPQSLGQSIFSAVRLLISSLLMFYAIAILANIGVEFGLWMRDELGFFSILGNLIYLISDAIRVLSPLTIGILMGLVAASLGSRYGQEAILRVDGMPARLITGVTSALGAGIAIFAIGSALNWLYQFDNPQYWTRYPAVIGGLIMFGIGFFVDPKKHFPIGFWIYTFTRSVLNIIRSIEPLIYVIVFAVWVGIGPFAGVLALTIHTVAALGKLFSEQVENIAEGPIEAITATGANSLQMIVFAVIPQIIPPYIAFTLYRWDINVRFSTIIGFAGGGGIGFVLVQNINLLKYRQAAVMMIAIAVVVMSLDYVSSKIRTRIN